MKEMKFVATPEKTTLKYNEVRTLKSDKQFISIWTGDTVKATLCNGNVYTGEVIDSLEPWCISVRYKTHESIRFDVNCIRSIEILKYSELRAINDRGEDCTL